MITSKITTSITPNPKDFDFLVQLKAYIGKIPKTESKKQNNGTHIQVRLRSFLRKGKPWEKIKTPIPDVSVIKVPIKKQKIAALNLVISHMKRDFDVNLIIMV